MKSLVLLSTLLLVILSVPFGESEESLVGVVVKLFYVTVLSIGGYLLSSNRRWLVLFLCFAVPSLLVGAASATMPGVTGLVLVGELLALTLQVLLIWAVIRYSLFHRTAGSLDRIVAGICGYLIIGLMWANLYGIFEHQVPGSFLFYDGAAVTKDGGAFLYFSLVTLSTLGYGDIRPTDSLPQMLAALEAVMGTLYLAVFVASLVSSVGTAVKRGDGAGGGDGGL